MQTSLKSTLTTLGAALAVAGGLFAHASAAVAADPHQVGRGGIAISDRVVRASLAGSPNSAAYMVISNAGGQPDQLLAARCACAVSAQVHRTETNGNMTSMAPTGPLTIPAHGKVVLAPGGMHLMLMHLKEPLKAGGQQTITLIFQKAGAVSANFRIRGDIAASTPAPMHGMPGMPGM